MEKRRLHSYYIYALAGIFLATAVIGFSDARKMDRIKLFFKDRRTGCLVAQFSSVPRVHTLNERIAWILRELSAGPVDSRYERTVAPDMQINEVIVQGRVAYVSLDWDFVDSLSFNPSITIQSVVKSILHNVRGLDDIRILIDGVEPVNTFYGLSLASKKKH
jgi:hypothetical protein